MKIVDYYSSPPLISSHARQEQATKLKTTELLAKEAPVKLPFLKRVTAVVLEGRLISGLKRRLKPVVVSIGKSALRRPWIKRSVLAVLNSSPDIKNRLYRLVWKDIALSPRSMRIYTALSTAIPTHRATQSEVNE